MRYFDTALRVLLAAAASAAAAILATGVALGHSVHYGF